MTLPLPLPLEQLSACAGAARPGYADEYWRNELASLVTAAGLDPEDLAHEEQLNGLISDHPGLPALDRDTVTVDRDLITSCS